MLRYGEVKSIQEGGVKYSRIAFVGETEKPKKYASTMFCAGEMLGKPGGNHGEKVDRISPNDSEGQTEKTLSCKAFRTIPKGFFRSPKQ